MGHDSVFVNGQPESSRDEYVVAETRKPDAFISRSVSVTEPEK